MRTSLLGILVLSALLISGPAAQAAPVGTTPDTRPAAPQQRKQWTTQGVSLQLSGSGLIGNVNLLNLSSLLSYNLNLDKHQFFLDFGNLYTKAGSNEVANRINGSVLYAYNALDNFNIYAYSTHSTDRSIKLNYRLTNGAGVCLHKIASPVFNLFLVSLGLAYENEWFENNISPSALRSVLRVNAVLPLGETAEAGVDSFYTPVVNDFGDYRIYAEAFVKFQLTPDLISLKLSVADEYDSRPQPGVMNNDFGVFATLGLDWGY
ncbi:hypothetical protein COW36_21185 [bacterium (Candidatus Blackallbacteria) CG17_big_fil_post_rev_8_21_14_2_50_48_46]|uniref:DUF481 domain-containing protein n=1 Tax=bacterium (Candidatus Blackallbacteria) CG17_big_fil_post_rev_8_21_14_2_50_48_46 TaxID=2014261 RepID=A0A2M7FZ92_9BACT|nr:MAG: hypothetical protein COW64_14495 [bacterium (Candidatus Blackallbacteria) CG18_big_fil_WC_8_21_14_2_50_49_26]PIW14555.1 MAG: hypothetical protein COW36_21185 [bacterium (Candidatus Blackallbacteria) CG17_big_fil_post_rev_8_21_14_2_50_48_46]PIW47240.1 MAG: hypothetical protein COW20_13630 [bacterium (Candidatus Blackallbacteria) CG13_big_fil_rev_8_21_14_2_50_49_14]